MYISASELVCKVQFGLDGLQNPAKEKVTVEWERYEERIE